MVNGTSRDGSRAPRMVALVALALTAAHLYRFRSLDFTVDDAWITFRVALNWVQHGTPTYDPSRPPVESSTSPLWTALMAAWLWLAPQLRPIGAARLMGALAQLGAVMLAMRAAARLAARDRIWAMATTGLLLATCGSMACYAMSGLETGLWGFVVAGLIERASATLRDPRAARGLACWLALAFATRPEGALLGGLVLAWLGLSGIRRDLLSRLALVFVLSIGAVELWRMSLYGSPLPNTFYAKAAGGGAVFNGLKYLEGWLIYGAGPALLCVVGALLPERTLTALFGVALASAAGTALSGGDWMPGWRRLQDAMVLLAVLVGAAAARPGARAWWGRVGAAAMLAGNLVAAATLRDSGIFPHEVFERVGALISRTPGVSSVAALDIGRLGWSFPGHIFDLAGLTDAHIAHLAGGHAEKDWDEAYFRASSPELVLVTSLTPLRPLPSSPLHLRKPDRDIVASIEAHGGYTAHAAHEIAPGQWLVVFRRDDVTLPVPLWGPEDRELARFFGATGE